MGYENESLCHSYISIDMLFCVQIPGRENVLGLPYSGCHNISIASVNECGMSAFPSSAVVIEDPGILLYIPLKVID